MMLQLRYGVALAAALVHAVPLTIGAQAVNRAYLDTTCSPCQDFFRFANGAWLDSVVIPKDQDRWGLLPEMRRNAAARVRQILDSLAHHPASAHTPTERKLGTFYRACMDSTRTDEAALRALGPELRRIAAIHSTSELGAAVGRLQRHRVFALFWLVQGPAATDSFRITAEVRGFESAWTLPSRQSYVGADSASVRRRDAYVSMLTRVFRGLGEQPESAAVNARRVLAFETALAQARPPDTGPVDNRLSLAELERLAPAFDWRGFAREIGRPDLRHINMRPPPIVATIDSLVTAVPLAEWKAYLRWRLVLAVAPDLERFQGAVPSFMRMLTGRQQDPPPAQRCGALTTFLLGDGVARAYVARTFSPEAKAAARAMVDEMRQLLRERIGALEWLGPDSRRRALAKLNAMRMWIGYPDRWQDYDDVEIREGAFTANLLAARRHLMDRQLALIGTVLDRDRWQEANPAYVDATYYPSTNALLITAAQLQPPIFDPRGDPAVLYGAIGATIGHELTHAFDSGGRLINEAGLREPWWTPEEVAGYTRRAEMIVRQYDEYVIIDTIRQSGRATLSENIADIGGLTLAWLAYQRAMQGRTREIVDGFTPEQRFFIAYAQSFYRTAVRPEALRTGALRQTHSDAKWRVNGPLAHLAAFAEAFGCKASDAMVRAAHLRWSFW